MHCTSISRRDVSAEADTVARLHSETSASLSLWKLSGRTKDNEMRTVLECTCMPPGHEASGSVLWEQSISPYNRLTLQLALGQS